jgi:acyl-CoA synthetase (AMP-forming)/AMP-acid ligase II
MPGYWDDQAATAAAADQARWMHTGDLATLDADGYANHDPGAGPIDAVLHPKEGESPAHLAEGRTR